MSAVQAVVADAYRRRHNPKPEEPIGMGLVFVAMIPLAIPFVLFFAAKIFG